VLTTALLLAAIVSAPVALIVWVASGWLAVTFDSPAAAQALGLSASGLFLFPLNKILLSHANGLRRVRLYALAIAARLLFVVGGVAVFVAAGLDGAWIGLTLAAAEWALFLVLVVALRTELRRVDADTWTRWRRRHLRFGSRGVAGAVLFELNTRVDVFVLAFLTDMDSVGVYSMATIFVEGLFQLLIVLRWSYDPQIARLVVEQRHAELIGLVRSGRRLAYGGMLAVGALAVALYPWVVELLVGRAAYDPSAPVFALLAAGVILSAGYVPFSGLLQQAGHPGAQSLLLLAVVLTNLLGKLALVPAWGLLGAAAAFSFAQVAFVFYLRLLVRRRVGLAI
jgi:O-antigen/teichoic acid export membrane protein